MNHKLTFLSFFKKNLFLFAALMLVVLFYILEIFFASLNSKENIANNFQRDIDSQIEILSDASQIVNKLILSENDVDWEAIDLVLKKNKIKCFIYSNDSILFWNAQQDDFFVKKLSKCETDTIILRNREWFLLNVNSCDSINIILYKSINEFPFSENLFSQLDFSLTYDLLQSEYVINNRQGEALIGFDFSSINSTGFLSFIILFVIYLSFAICLILWIYHLFKGFKTLKNNSIRLFILFSISVFILRAIDNYFSFPLSLKSSFLFTNVISSVSFFNTIGDLITSGIMILVVVSIFYLLILNKNVWTWSNYKKVTLYIISSSLLFVVSYSFSYILSQTIEGLNYDSIFGLDFYTISGFGIIFIILIYNASLFLIIKSFEYLFLNVSISWFVAIIPIISISTILYFLNSTNQELVFLIAGLLLFFIIIFKLVHEQQYISIIKQLLFIILLASFSTIIINTQIRQTRDLHQKTSAKLLTKEKDSEFEELFQKAYHDIINDTIFLKELYQNESEDRLSNYLKSTYFPELSNRFNIQVMVCSEGELLKIQPEGFITECSNYFNQLIANEGKSAIDSSLFLINGESESMYYIGKLKLTRNQIESKEETIYLEFFNSIVPEGFGYTELLIDTKSDSLDLTGYSFAWYQNDQLVYKFGNFPYQTNFNFLKEFQNEAFFDFMGYRNLKLQVSSDKYFVISRPSQQLTEQLATFSLLFIVFGGIILLVFLFVYRHQAGSIFTLNFRIRLQFFFIGTISLIIILFAIITFYYLESNNANRLKLELNEKTQSVIIELQHKLSGTNDLNNLDNDELYQLLSKFSLVFFSDINLYDLNGNLVASSRPEIFSRGLQSKRINPKAYNELSRKNQLYYLTEENIGPVFYYSSYAPLVIGDNQLVGFVNLPYFARQFDIKRSYFLMFSTFINLFVILGILGTLLALFLSKILIKPLAVLQKSLATIQIEKPNTKIEWNINDEIGLLIKEYNRMIDKLEQSTIMLKHSERESAWREVARQIAHEIKNPLTPMKLNVQYLEKAYSENDPKFDEKIKNISASLVKQIDTLDKVAEMFSDFAKMKTGNFDEVNLFETVKSCVSLFRNNSSIKIEIISGENTDNYLILAFEKDILRVFNNLIKNSIQSIEGKPAGKVEIVFDGDKSHIIVQVIDDGKGISDTVKSSIFQPYFTTKTGGTGLGLAIVKNIMTEIGGEISFESSTDKGTRFILKFKRFNQKSA